MTSFQEKPSRWTLPNGLTVVYRQSHGIPFSAVTLLIHAGSLQEQPSQAGLASLTTELLLQGTRCRTARQITDAIESIGMSLGAQASDDYTEFALSTPTPHLPHALEVLRDCLTNPTFPAFELTKERAQTLAALRTRHDSIFQTAYDTLNTHLYPGHPYGRPSDGFESTVRSFTRRHLQAWHRSVFRPESTVLSLITTLPREQAQRLIQRVLGKWKAGDKRTQPPATAADPTPPKKAKRIRLRGAFEQAYYMTAVPAPSLRSPEALVLKVLNTLWGGGMSSRLFMRLREEHGLAYEVSSFYPSHLGPSQWVTYFGCEPAKLAQASAFLETLIAELIATEPSLQEVTQAVRMLKGSFLMDRQTRRRRAWYGAWWEFLGRDQSYGEEFIALLERITPQEVHFCAQRLLQAPRLTVEVVPKGYKE